MSVTVRPIKQEDYADWYKLWQDYTAFYQEELSDKVTLSTWNRVFDEDSAIQGHVAEIEGKVVGFSLSVIQEATWTDRPICYLEDLYVDENIRGKGCGRALIDNLIEQCKEQGFSRLYWHTNADNDRARALYDSYKLAEDKVKYRLFFDE